jgi:hypothetical protein
MSDLIIVADLGAISVFEIVKDPLKIQSDKLKMIKSLVMTEPRIKAAQKFSDSAGRFYQGGGAEGTVAGFGEQHNIELETERRLIKGIAGHINEMAAEKDCDKWFLAADKSINNQILEYLTPAVKAKLRKNVALNLTKSGKHDIMRYFIERPRKIA